ncbi:MAG: TonB-dependent receptor, partial [Pseudomonadota bacterium]
AETPFSVNILTADLIDNLQARRLSDIIRRDPSVTVNTGVASFTSSQNIRGFNTGQSNFFDGLGPQFVFNGLNPLHGYEQVEIIKGPSTAFKGAAAFAGIGGTINFVPKRAPKDDNVIREVGFTYSQNDLLVGSLDIGERFGSNNQFGYRFNALHEDGNLRGNDVARDVTALDLVLDWTPTDEFKLFGGVHYLDTTISSYVGELFLPLGIEIPEPPDASEQIAQSWGFVAEESTFGEIGVEWKPVSGLVITGQYLNGQLNRPYLTGDGGEVLAPDNPIYNDPSEYREGDFLIDVFQNENETEFENGALSLRYDTSFGEIDSSTVLLGSFGSNDGKSRFIVIDGFVSNLQDPIFVDRPVTEADPAFDQFRNYENYSYGIANTFGYGPIELLLGLRRVEIEYGFTNIGEDDPFRSYDDGATLPVAALSYRPNDNLLLYANYGEGFLEGGTAPDDADNRLELFGPLESDQIEVGAKWEVIPEFVLSAAVFQIERTSEFTETLPDPNDENKELRFFRQDGLQRHRGVEFLVSGAATEDLRLFGGVTLLDAEIVEAGDEAINGSTPTGVPEVSISMFSEYRLPVRGLFVNASVEYKSDQEVELPNDRTLDSFTRFDLGGRYEFEINGKPARVTANVQNVTDDNYWASYGFGLSVAEPRTFNIGIDVGF